MYLKEQSHNLQHEAVRVLKGSYEADVGTIEEKCQKRLEDSKVLQIHIRRLELLPVGAIMVDMVFLLERGRLPQLYAALMYKGTFLSICLCIIVLSNWKDISSSLPVHT